MAVYLALDPGGTTGCAIFNGNHDDGISTWEDVYDEYTLHDTLESTKPDIIICENFLWQPRNKVDFRPVKALGIIEGYCTHSGTKLVMQNPSTGKGFWTNAKLKACGEYVVGSEHERDAVRHLLHYLSFKVKDMHWIRLLKH